MKGTIDINCDLGEGTGIEAAVMPYITSANIACGYHAGDQETIDATIRLCLQQGVAIGAHPSFDDRKNFGRKEMNLPDENIFKLVQDQIMIIQKAAGKAGGKVHHVKPHGALYNMASRDARLAAVIAAAVRETDESFILYGLSGSHLVSEGIKAGLQVANEVFADRTYRDDGNLTPRSDPEALISNVEQSIAQCMQMILEGKVTTVNGKIIDIIADTICIHGDGPHAETLAKAIYRELQKEKIIR